MYQIKPYLATLSLSVLCLSASLQAETAPQAIKVMLLTGRSNKHHNWKASSAVIHQHLLDAKIFQVDKIVTTPTGESLGDFAPIWSAYDVVVLDYEGEEWAEPTKTAFVEYMKNGGGLVTVHAANNTFPHWPAFNDIIGLGGWGGSKLHNPPLYPDDPAKHSSRNERWGPRVYWQGCQAVHDHTPGRATHPPRHDFIMTNRNPSHPIMQGLPEMWLQAQDEIYSNLRGPAKNLTILATAFANPAMQNASPFNEPILFTVRYGKGRTFQTTLGHVGTKEGNDASSINNVSFISTLQRGTEWAATGSVTLPVPDDFPNAYQTSVRSR